MDRICRRRSCAVARYRPAALCLAALLAAVLFCSHSDAAVPRIVTTVDPVLYDLAGGR